MVKDFDVYLEGIGELYDSSKRGFYTLQEPFKQRTLKCRLRLRDLLKRVAKDVLRSLLIVETYSI